MSARAAPAARVSRRALLAAPVGLLGLAGCATPMAADGAGAPLTVGTIPNVSSAAASIAQLTGVFDAHGISVKLTPATGFAPNVASVVNGENQAGFAAIIPLLVASTKGAPITLIAGTDRIGRDVAPEDDPAAIAVLPDSPIRSARDLEGRSVAVTALGAIQDLGVRIKMAQEGADPDAVDFLTLPSADMIAALQAKRVDAVALSEPFTTRGRAEGLRSIFSYSTATMPGLPVAAFFSSQRTVQGRPEDIAAFVASVKEVTEQLAADPALLREQLPNFTKIPPEAAAKVHSYEYTTEITDAQVQELSDLLLEYGYTSDPVDIDAVLGRTS